MIITASYLFAQKAYNPGEYKCFYCGIPCNAMFSKKDFVKGTFTNRDIVHYPGSDFVCGCCVESLITGYETTLIDGEIKTGRGVSPRMYSWIITQEERWAFTKKHLIFARDKVLNPPPAPFVMVFADSGQKQLIFRAPVNYDANAFKVLLEDKEILVYKESFFKILTLSILVSAAIGKVSLLNPDSFLCYKSIIEKYDTEIPLVEWVKIYKSPMGELAAWLCPGKDEANGIIDSGHFQEEDCGACGSIKELTARRRRGDKVRSNKLHRDATPSLF